MMSFTKTLHSFLLISLHCIFHLIQSYSTLRPTTTTHQTTTTTTTNPFYHILNPIHPNPIDQPHSIIYSNNNSDNNSSAILITNHSDLNPLTLQLAFNFAALGYHVFLQVSSQSQLTQLIIRWQTIKSKLNKSFNNLHSIPNRTPEPSSLIGRILNPFLAIHQLKHPHHRPPTIGTIIPLLYLTPDVAQRLEAISTISAYVRQNHIAFISLINIIDPHRIRKSYPASSHSPCSSTFALSRLSQSNPPCSSPQTSPSASSTRPLTGIVSPAGSDHSNGFNSPATPKSSLLAQTTSTNSELYDSQPLPLSIVSDVYLFDALGDTLLGPLSTVQDLLLLLKNHGGRVINIWDGNRHPQTGLTSILLDGFRKTTQVLKAELHNLDIPVSIVYAPTEKPADLEQPRFLHTAVTNDPRSLLSEATDADLLETFTQHAAGEAQKEHLASQARPASDLITAFNLVRLVLESRRPSPVYPIGLPEVAGLLGQLVGLDRLLAGLQNLLSL